MREAIAKFKNEEVKLVNEDLKNDDHFIAKFIGYTIDIKKLKDGSYYMETRGSDNSLAGKCSSNDFNYILSEAMESVEGDIEFMEGVIQECKDVLKGYHKKYGDKSKKIRVITNESDSFSVLRYGDDFDICGHGLSNWDWIMLLNNLGYEVERIVASDDELDRIL